MSQADEPQGGNGREKAKASPPFSLRLSDRERAHLKTCAGDLPLGTYIRSRLLGDETDKPRHSRRPRTDEQAAARLLAELGRSRLASNLNQLARAANIGSLHVDPDAARELHEACRAIRDMRAALMTALGVNPEQGR